MLHTFLSYCKSHIYELHALLSATIAFLLMFPLKRPLKRTTEAWVERKAGENETWRANREMHRKRCNMLVIAVALVLSGALFAVISVISPLIGFSWYTVLLTGAFTLTEYAVYDQIFGKRGKE